MVICRNLNVRRTKQTLWTAAALLTTGGVGTLVLTIVSAPSVPTAAVPNSPPPRERSPREIDRLPDREQLAIISRLDLRRPLADPAPKAVERPAPPPLNVRLAGTITERGQDRAILITPSGKTELKSVGESSGGAEILQIQPTSVRLRYEGVELTVHVAQKQEG